MKLIGDLRFVTPAMCGGAVTVGNFDGVHRGHARIIATLVEAARRVGGPSVVFTFDPHPVRLLRPAQCPPPLTWTDRKAELLAELGVDVMIAFPPDEAFLQMSAEDFFATILRDRLQARALVEGPNFYFGKDRRGNVELLERLASGGGMSLEVVPALQMDGDTVSSSRIRRAVAVGAVGDAAVMLTRPYRIRGMVTHGAARGARLGFPTANLEAVDTLIPGPGVYAGKAFIQAATAGQQSWPSHSAWPAAIHIGPNPTFGESALKVEVHLIGFAGSLYGQPLEVEFLERLRDIVPFESVDQLCQQLQRDVERAGGIAKERTAGGS